MLSENNRIFLEYGPYSIRANDPLSPTAHIWREKCRNIIIPNNDKIIDLITKNSSFIPKSKLSLIEDLVNHNEGLKQNYFSGHQDRRAPLFPKEINNIFSEDTEE